MQIELIPTGKMNTLWRQYQMAVQDNDTLSRAEDVSPPLAFSIETRLHSPRFPQHPVTFRESVRLNEIL